MFEFPYPDPIAFHIWKVPIRWYGLMYLAGFVIGWILARRRARDTHSPIAPAQVDDLVFYAAMGVIVGGRLGYVFFYGFDNLLRDPSSIIKIWQGGMSFHGGLIGVLLAMALLARHKGLKFFEVIDFLAPLGVLGLGFGRIGNFINNELWGKVTDPEAPWAVIVDGVPRHASQLYEAALEGFVLFAVLWWYSSRPRPVRAVSGLFFLLYGLFRSSIEFVRVPDQHIGYLAFDWLTMGHVLSAPMIVLGVVLLVSAYRGAVSNAGPVGEVRK